MEDIDSRPSVCFQFQVEKILGISADGRYLVQWAPAWVSKFHLVGCEHLIQEFIQKQPEMSTGIDDLDSLEAVDTVDGTRDNSEQYAHVLPTPQPGMRMGQTTVLQSECYNGNKQQPAANCIPQQQSEKDVIKTELDYTAYHMPPELDPDSCTKEKKVIENDPCDETLSQTLEDFPVEVKEENMTVEDCAWTSINQPHSISSRENDFANINYEHDSPPVGSEDDTPTCDEGIGNHPSSSQEDELSSVTSSKKIHACSVWDKTFGRRFNLVRHLRTHSGQLERPFKCTECHKLFTEKHNLIIHMRMHNGVRPFSCGTCGKSFTQSYSLRRHNQRFHSNET